VSTSSHWPIGQCGINSQRGIDLLAILQGIYACELVPFEHCFRDGLSGAIKYFRLWYIRKKGARSSNG